MKQLYDAIRILRMLLSAVIIQMSLLIVVAAPAASDTENALHCDIQLGSCIMRTGYGMTIEFDIQPKPVAAMTENTFAVKVTRNGMPITDASVHLDLSMPHMFMGKNQPIMKHTKDGRYEGKGVITRCASGRRKWQADVAVVSAGKTAVAAFVFEVK
jgi:YtkA-like